MAQLGFDTALRVAEPEPGAPPRAAKKQAARAHAKDYRRARKGERRSRGAPIKSGRK